MSSAFLDLPLDVLKLIIEACSPNDRVCLRLASKALYALPFNTQTSSSSTSDALEQKIPLTQADAPLLCRRTLPKNDMHTILIHRALCHGLCKAEHLRRKAIELGKDPSGIVAPHISHPDRPFGGRPAVRNCQVRRNKNHCECFNRPLWKRLESWIRDAKGEDFRYCSQCHTFTKRTKQSSGRCRHGKAKAKPKYQKRNFWTYKKGYGGYRWKSRTTGRK